MSVFGKAGPHGIRDILGDFITVRADRRADSGIDVFRSAAVGSPAFSGYVTSPILAAALPATVGQCDHSPHGIIKIDGHTIRMGGIEHDSRNVGDQSVDIRVVSFSGNTLACVRRTSRSSHWRCGSAVSKRCGPVQHQKNPAIRRKFSFTFSVRVIETAPEIKAGKPSLRDTAPPLWKNSGGCPEAPPMPQGQERKRSAARKRHPHRGEILSHLFYISFSCSSCFTRHLHL